MYAAFGAILIYYRSRLLGSLCGRRRERKLATDNGVSLVGGEVDALFVLIPAYLKLFGAAVYHSCDVTQLEIVVAVDHISRAINLRAVNINAVAGRCSCRGIGLHLHTPSSSADKPAAMAIVLFLLIVFPPFGNL